ncbi:Sugar transporter [Mycena venus]|uniref:Sugar transporter n=1 Tax=Mycena venus TaxID=2733690 RepID=A0A8H6XMD7_9AGAR|nr:Sugar transporter [Mycena venus]
MLVSTLFTILTAGIATAAPLARRDVKPDDAATAEAQKFDATATRAFTATTITTSDGRCLSVDPFSGDFRENLTPVNVATCDGSKNQTWDVITSGVHNNVKGQALIVSSLTNACLNFDARRAPGNQVLLFSCGGRADGGGLVAVSQLFAFSGSAGPQALVPQVGKNAICLTVKGNVIDQTACDGAASATGAELFTFGSKAAATNEAAATAAATTSAADCVASTVTKTVTVAIGDSAAPTNIAIVDTTSDTRTTAVAATATAKAATTTAATATAPIKVSGAGGTLNPTAVAEAQKRDDSATRAATGVQIKSSDGQCLSVDPTAGDFRENLISIAVKKCDGSAGQRFDFITKGVHNDRAGQTLIVSSLTNGCLNFDDRRAAGDQVIMFSCGGRGDGSGLIATSQLFPFVDANLKAPYALTPSNAKGVCFVNNNGRLSNVNCDTANPAANEHFTIVA